MTDSNAILTILGCGTSTGVPLPACTCVVCTSKNPRNKRDRASAWLRTAQGTSILVDAGPDLRQQALAQSIPRVDAVLFTHAHSDHILGVEDLRGFNLMQRTHIDCYGTEETLQAIRNTFPYIFNPDPTYEGGMLARLKLHTINHFEPLRINDVTVIPFPLQHGSMPVTGYRFGSLAYATDCNAVPADSMELLTGIPLLVIDGLRHQPHGTHFTIGEAIATGNRLGAHHIYLTHMTHSIDYDSESASLPEGVSFCYDGLQLPVSLA